MDIRLATEQKDMDSRDIYRNDSNLNVVLDVPWSRVQHLIQESDSMLHSRSINQSRHSRSSMEDSGDEICQKCNSKTQELEEKMAEVQQQLTVAVSSNFTKNVMIEQLDKTLSKIVEGWKKLESEKITQINNLEKERNKAKEDLKREQEVLIKVERELTLTLDKLMLSQKEIQQVHNDKQTWMSDYESKISNLSKELELKQNRNANLTATNKNIVADYENKIRDLNHKLVESAQEWELHEDKYKSQIKDYHISLNGFQQERIQNEQAVKTLKLQLQLLSNQLNDLLREKESLKVEVSILQARNEAEKIETEEKEKVVIESIKKDHKRNLLNLEETLQTQYEKKSGELENQFSKLLDQQIQKKVDEDARERAVLEVEYEKAMQDQADRYKQQIHLKEMEFERQYQCKDDQLRDCREQIKQLQKENDILASSRSHLMARIQDLLQNQWQESLKILYGNSDGSQPPLRLSLSNLPIQNMSRELDYLPSSESSVADYEAVNLHKLHSGKATIQKSQSQSQIPTILRRNSDSSNLLHSNSRMSFKRLPSKPNLQQLADSCVTGHQSKGKNLTLPPTNLFDDFESFTRIKLFPEKCDSSDDVSIDYCLDDNDKNQINELKRTNEEEMRCTSSLASRFEPIESVCSSRDGIPSKVVRKTQSLLERMPSPEDEISKMTKCSDSFPISEIFSETERRQNNKLLFQKHRFCSGADKLLSDSINRHEERQVELKKYLEKLLQRPPGEPYKESKDFLPCKDENNCQVDKKVTNNSQQPNLKKSRTFGIGVPRLHLPPK